MLVSFDTPILLMVFNRPEAVKKVFAEIRKQKPKHLFIAADGPRANNPEDARVVDLVRKSVLQQIDWDCEVKTLFREKNIGCGKACADAITWFFNYVEQGIILEDDCVPNEDFFNFCRELLDRYKDNERIMHISGNNFQLSEVSRFSYFYTNTCHMWGWATWKRAWKLYDFDMKCYSDQWDFNGFVTDKFEKRYWRNLFNKVKSGEVDTWDFQWTYSCWKNNGLSIMPKVNLVKNIGHGPDGTHTVYENILEDLKTYCFEEMIYPPEILRNLKADKWHADIMMRRNYDFLSIMYQKISSLKNRIHNYLND